MASGDYIIIRKHPNGGFAAVVGNVLNTQVFPPATPNLTKHTTVAAALTWAKAQPAGNRPVGIAVHGECDR